MVLSVSFLHCLLSVCANNYRAGMDSLFWAKIPFVLKFFMGCPVGCYMGVGTGGRGGGYLKRGREYGLRPPPGFGGGFAGWWGVGVG